MRRKMNHMYYLTSFFIILLLISEFSCSGETITKQPPTTLIVSVDDSGDYTSIQQAIENAIEGSTIIIKPGTYSELLNIEKSIILLGEDKDTTFIISTSKPNGCAINIKASYVTISGFTISNLASGLYATAIKITSSHVTISNCNIQNNPIGIANWGYVNRIENCYFSDCSDEGIFFVGTKESSCEKNVIENCQFTRNCDGIEFFNAQYNNIINCNFFSNTHSGLSFVGDADANSGNTIGNCRIYENVVYGIYLSGSQNQIIECSVVDNANGNVVVTKNSLNNNIQIHESSQTSLLKIQRQPLRNIIHTLTTFFQIVRLRYQ